MLSSDVYSFMSRPAFLMNSFCNRKSKIENVVWCRSPWGISPPSRAEGFRLYRRTYETRRGRWVDSSGSATGVGCAAVGSKKFAMDVAALIAGSLFLGFPLWVPIAMAELLTWFLVRRTIRKRQKRTERHRLRKQFWGYE